MSKIFNISEAASLAIHSLALIAKSEKQINANMIAEMTNFSKNHLSKILQRLVKYDYIRSERGPKGGFVLNKDSKEITLLEIYETIEGVLEIPKCKIHKGDCLFSSCIYGGMGEKLTSEFREYLKNKTIYDAIK
ncbi:MAG: Rrf2 family transcriptional regulator [Bacteroidetes bacterium]|nr:Rrf2 family transcriptional regulator [Bacteroidota bacterium]